MRFCGTTRRPLWERCLKTPEKDDWTFQVNVWNSKKGVTDIFFVCICMDCANTCTIFPVPCQAQIGSTLLLNWNVGIFLCWWLAKFEHLEDRKIHRPFKYSALRSIDDNGRYTYWLSQSLKITMSLAMKIWSTEKTYTENSLQMGDLSSLFLSRNTEHARHFYCLQMFGDFSTVEFCKVKKEIPDYRVTFMDMSHFFICECSFTMFFALPWHHRESLQVSGNV